MSDSVSELRAAVQRADDAIEGDSNDEEIDALRDALNLALERWPELDDEPTPAAPTVIPDHHEPV